MSKHNSDKVIKAFGELIPDITFSDKVKCLIESASIERVEEEDISIDPICEAKLTAEERRNIPSDKFGIPELQLFPLIDAEHVKAAIRYFGTAKPKYRKELARRIKNEIDVNSYNININTKSKINNYLPKEKVAESLASEIFITGNDIISYAVEFGGNKVHDTIMDKYKADDTALNFYSKSSDSSDNEVIFIMTVFGKFSELPDLTGAAVYDINSIWLMDEDSEHDEMFNLAKSLNSDFAKMVDGDRRDPNFLIRIKACIDVVEYLTSGKDCGRIAILADCVYDLVYKSVTGFMEKNLSICSALPSFSEIVTTAIETDRIGLAQMSLSKAMLLWLLYNQDKDLSTVESLIRNLDNDGILVMTKPPKSPDRNVILIADTSGYSGDFQHGDFETYSADILKLGDEDLSINSRMFKKAFFDNYSESSRNLEKLLEFIDSLYSDKRAEYAVIGKEFLTDTSGLRAFSKNIGVDGYKHFLIGETSIDDELSAAIVTLSTTMKNRVLPQYYASIRPLSLPNENDMFMRSALNNIAMIYSLAKINLDFDKMLDCSILIKSTIKFEDLDNYDPLCKEIYNLDEPPSCISESAKSTNLKPSEYQVFDDRVEIRFKDWKASRGHNILLVTGVSGSGKSTISSKLSGVVISLDNLEHLHNGNCEYAKEFVEERIDIKNEIINLDEKAASDYLGNQMSDYIKWLLDKLSKDYKNKYIIEGVQWYMCGPEIERYFTVYPSIVMTTDPMESFERVSIRNGEFGDDVYGRHPLDRVIRHSEYINGLLRRLGVKLKDRYSRPMTAAQIKNAYPSKAAVLLADPVHSWRAETGIELIHEEPTVDEQMRISANWDLMSDKMKKQSDKKSMELFGMTNEEHDKKIMSEKWGAIVNESATSIINEKININDRILKSGTRHKTKSGDVLVPVYVVLTRNETAFGKAIRAVTGAYYNHASVTLDTSLTNIFSFNADPVNGGFILEDITKGNFKSMADSGSEYALYVTFLAEDSAKKMEDSLTEMLMKANEYTYSMKGVFRYMLNLTTDDENSMFCSEFVGRLLKAADETLVDKHPSKIAPMDLITERFDLISKGPLKDYNEKNTKKEVDKLLKKFKFNKKINENAGVLNMLYNSGMDSVDVIRSIFSDNHVTDYFYPSFRFPIGVMNAGTLGGIYPDAREIVAEYQSSNKTSEDLKDLENKISDLVDISYNPKNNIFSVSGLTNVTHIVYATLLRMYYEDIINGRELAVIEMWEEKVKSYYDLLQIAIKDGNDEEIRLFKQSLIDIYWHHSDDPYDGRTVTVNMLHMACTQLKYIGTINEDSLLDLTTSQAQLTKILSRSANADYISPSTLEYPVFDFNSFILAAIEFENIDPSIKGSFVENFRKLLPKYAISEKDKIPTSFKISNYIPVQYREVIRLDTPLSEGIKTEAFNFSLDDDGNILIETKERSDFPAHFKTSKKLLDTYAHAMENGTVPDGVKYELCKLYYMAQVIELYYIQNPKKLKTRELSKRKEMVNTRALILSVFDLYLKKVLEIEPHFNFHQYYAHSPYGNAIKISKKELQAVLSVASTLYKFL